MSTTKITDDDFDLNIDDRWLREFKEKEKDYNDFYKDKPTSIKLYFLYVNKYNVIEFFKNDTYLLNQENIPHSVLRKDVLLSIIKNNMQINGRNYKLMSLLKFNLDIEPEDILNMTLNKKDGLDYLTSEKEIKDILFHDTIGILQDINSLFFVYQERFVLSQPPSSHTQKQKQNQTHKNVKNIYFTHSRPTNKNYTFKKKNSIV